MMMWGQGITLCAFCRSRVLVVVRGDVLTIMERGGQFVIDGPVFCSDECEMASESRLDEQVNRVTA